MNPAASLPAFAGSVPELYERLMVPLVFEPYAADLARRVAALAPARVLETAAGTGAVTRALVQALPASTQLVATDLSTSMIERAQAVGTARPVQWQACDAMQLPFDDASFDLVCCQFGAMFFPDKPRAFAEAWRVLRPGGRFVFSVWDRIETSEITHAVHEALAARFRDDPLRFITRGPHGYFDTAQIAADLARGGFAEPPVIEGVTAMGRANDALSAAAAFCQGTPLRAEIESRGATALEATELAAAELVRRFGSGPIEGSMKAWVVSAVRPR